MLTVDKRDQEFVTPARLLEEQSREIFIRLNRIRFRDAAYLIYGLLAALAGAGVWLILAHL